VAVLDDVLYVMGGHDDVTTHKTAERYGSKTDEWSLIADMTVRRVGASATALNGNRNIMKKGEHSHKLRS
jgi:N-acetylneuraminic acid mutarotase